MLNHHIKQAIRGIRVEEITIREIRIKGVISPIRLIRSQ